MEKGVLFFVVLLLLVGMFVGCGETLDVVEPQPSSEVETPMPEEVLPVPYVPVEPEPDVPSWEVALEEFLSEFLPVFTAGTVEEMEWGQRGSSGWRRFLREYTFVDEAFPNQELFGFYFADPVTGEMVDSDTVPYIMMLQGELEDGDEWSAEYIATDFFLYDMEQGDAPVLLIRWSSVPGDPFGFESAFRYTNGTYEPVRVLEECLWREEVIDGVELFHFGPSVVRGLLAQDSEGRILVLGMGGAGGVESSAHILNLTDDGIRLEPVFWMRFGWVGEPENEFKFRLIVNEDITGEQASLPEVDGEDVMFFPWDWMWGEGDMSPVPIPIMPDVTVAPLVRLVELEQRLAERVAANLLAAGRVLP